MVSINHDIEIRHAIWSIEENVLARVAPSSGFWSIGPFPFASSNPGHCGKFKVSTPRRDYAILPTLTRVKLKVVLRNYSN